MHILDFGKYIKELLLLHDCVILPGLGGFVANYKPAEFDTIRNTVSPPSKQILFNTRLVHNDGLLFAHVSDAAGYGYKDVENMASSYIEGIRRDSRKGDKFNIGGLGYFYLDAEGKIQFTEEAGNNFLVESYGLPLLQYKEVEKQPVPETYRSFISKTDPIIRQKRRRLWAYGTAAACLLTAMIFVPVKTGYFNQAGIDIPITDSFQKKQATHAGITPAISTAPASKSFLPDAEYHIVVGSFKYFGNARQLRNQLVDKGFESRILSMANGFFRVSAGTYSDQGEATNQLSVVRAEHEKAWVLSN